MRCFQNHKESKPSIRYAAPGSEVLEHRQEQLTHTWLCVCWKGICFYCSINFEEERARLPSSLNTLYCTCRKKLTNIWGECTFVEQLVWLFSCIGFLIVGSLSAVGFNLGASLFLLRTKPTLECLRITRCFTPGTWLLDHGWPIEISRKSPQIKYFFLFIKIQKLKHYKLDEKSQVFGKRFRKRVYKILYW